MYRLTDDELEDLATSRISAWYSAPALAEDRQRTARKRLVTMAELDALSNSERRSDPGGRTPRTPTGDDYKARRFWLGTPHPADFDSSDNTEESRARATASVMARRLGLPASALPDLAEIVQLVLAA